MHPGLLLILGLIGLLALYWALFGQWKHNKMLREAEMKAAQIEYEKKEVDK